MPHLPLRLLLPGLVALVLSACDASGPPDQPFVDLAERGVPESDPDPRLAGVWAATLDTPVEPRPLVLELSFEGAELRAALRSPGQGDAAISLSQVRADGPELAVATPLGAFVFEGRLDGENRLSGTLRQGGLTSPIVWTRIDPAG